MILDAEAILTEYEEQGKFSLKNLRYCDKRVEEAIEIELTEEEKKAVVIRYGKPYLILGNGKTFLEAVHYEEGWLPPEN